MAETAHVRPSSRRTATVVRNVDDGGYYRFAGGAPLVVRCDIGAGLREPAADRQRHVRRTTARHGGDASTCAVSRVDGTTVTNIDDGTF